MRTGALPLPEAAAPTNSLPNPKRVAKSTTKSLDNDVKVPSRGAKVTKSLSPPKATGSSRQRKKFTVEKRSTSTSPQSKSTVREVTPPRLPMAWSPRHAVHAATIDVLCGASKRSQEFRSLDLDSEFCPSECGSDCPSDADISLDPSHTPLEVPRTPTKGSMLSKIDRGESKRTVDRGAKCLHCSGALWRAEALDAWKCDGCASCRTVQEGLDRYACRLGCDYQLCQTCYGGDGGARQLVDDPSARSPNKDFPKRRLAAVSVAIAT